MKKHHQYRTGLLTIYQGCLVCPWFSFWCVIFVRRMKTYNIFPVCSTTWVIIGSFTLLSTAATFEEIERERLQEAFWSFRAEFGADLEDFAYQLQGRRVARLSQATSILTSLDFCKESPFDKKETSFFLY